MAMIFEGVARGAASFVPARGRAAAEASAASADSAARDQWSGPAAIRASSVACPVASATGAMVSPAITARGVSDGAIGAKRMAGIFTCPPGFVKEVAPGCAIGPAYRDRAAEPAPMPTLRQIEYWVAAVEEGSFGRAA